MKKDREKNSNIANATIVGAVSEESVLYASANKEYLAILDDKTLGRTLEGISEYKVNPKYQYRNINQQAGFSAELKEQAHANAQNILMENKERLAMIVGACVANVTIFGRYLSGKIDETELLKQLGKANTTLISGGAMAVAGQALIPIPVVGALIGGFVGAVLSEAFFNVLNSKKVELARQKRIEIERECRESIRLLEMYRNQFKEVFEQYFHETTKFFNQSFDELERAIYVGDADLAIGVNNEIQEGLGQKPLFDNKQEGWDFITSRGRTEI